MSKIYKPMVSLDLPIKWQRSPRYLLEILRKAGVTHYKIHLAIDRRLEETVNLVRHSVLPGYSATVMFDNKEHDTSSTVVDALAFQRSIGFDLGTVHASGGSGMFKAIAAEKLTGFVVAVTVLTSLTDKEVDEVYGAPRTVVVRRFAVIAAKHGVDKFVCAVADIPHAQEAVKEWCEPIFFTPAIKPEWFLAKTEQHMAATPREAYLAGAHCPIVGRAILSAEQFGYGPGDAYKQIVSEFNPEPPLPFL